MTAAVLTFGAWVVATVTRDSPVDQTAEAASTGSHVDRETADLVAAWLDGDTATAARASERIIAETPGNPVAAAIRHALDPRQCWMVGDREGDIDAGHNAGIRAAAVCTGKHDAAGWAALDRPGLPVFPSLVEFVAGLT